MPKSARLRSLGPAPSKSSPLLEREAYWKEHVRRWQSSGLSQSAYCRREGLRANQLSYWYRRDHRLDHDSASVTASSKFIPVEITGPSPIPAPSSLPSLKVRLSNGACLEVIDAQSVELAARLLKAL